MRPIDEAIVHCTATRADWWEGRSTADKTREVRRWHVQGNGWSDIGYHYLIDRDGTVIEGRPIERIGAHVRGHNTGTVGISLYGGHGGASTDNFADHFTPEQDAALRQLLTDLGERFPIKRITGHNRYSAKACPCFDVTEWLKEAPTRTAAPSVAPNPAQPAPSPFAALAALLRAIFGGRK